MENDCALTKRVRLILYVLHRKFSASVCNNDTLPIIIKYIIYLHNII